MKRICVYFSKKRDTDLLYIAKSLGIKNFRRLIALCLRGLFSERDAEEARRLVFFPPQSEGIADLDLKRGGVRVNLSISGRWNANVLELLSHIKEGQRSEFVKTSVRQVLGAKATLFGFLSDDIDESRIVVAKQSVAIVMVGGVSETKKTTKRKKIGGEKPDKKLKEEKPTLNKPAEEEKVPAGKRLVTYAPPTRIPIGNRAKQKQEDEQKAVAEAKEPAKKQEPAQDVDLLSMLEMMM